jgi:drug/metabolite transporter (DMT)-like permease
MSRNHAYPVFFALLAALLFGASAPLSKVLLQQVEPILLAGLLYLGSGASLLIVLALRHARRTAPSSEAGIGRADVPWLTGATLAGGIAAPIILLLSLRNTPGATASLLLNFEAVATTLIAAAAFRESVSGRAWTAILVITAASILLSVNAQAAWGFSFAAVGVLLACVLWGLDNNFTRNVSAKDPLAIATIKSLAAGTCSLALAIMAGNSLPAWDTVLRAMILGGLCYGLSLTLFIWALRGLGAARTSALFGTAPLAGIALSVLILHENLGAIFLLALALMIVGTMVLVGEKHEHGHVHEPARHEHGHSHADEHHAHAHDEVEVPGSLHAHEHAHARVEHQHGHMPDTHHRHGHASKPRK